MAGVRAEPAAGQQGWWGAKASLALTSLWGLWLGPLHPPFLTPLLQAARGEPPRAGAWGRKRSSGDGAHQAVQRCGQGPPPLKPESSCFSGRNRPPRIRSGEQGALGPVSAPQSGGPGEDRSPAKRGAPRQQGESGPLLPAQSKGRGRLWRMPDAQGMLPCPGYGQGPLRTLQSMAGLLPWIPVCVSQRAGALAAASTALQPSLPESCASSGGTSGAGRAGSLPPA